MTAAAFIVHWNSPESCNRLTSGLLDSACIREITVIDNHSDPQHKRNLRGNSERIKTVLLNDNLGWGGALNAALKPWLMSGADDCCLIAAHDALPLGNAVEMLCEALSKDPAWGCICPEYGLDEVPRYYRFRATRMIPAERREAGFVQEVDLCNATLLVIRRRCLEEIGLFDERMFAYGDEAELCLRAKRAGWKLGLCWGAIVKNPQTTTQSNLRTYLFTRNMLLLSQDYSGRMSTLLRAGWMPVKGICEMLSRRVAAGTGYSRLLGWRDWLCRRYGRPPASLLSQ